MAAGATYTPIATTTLGSAQASVTFSSIPSTYTDLILILKTGEDTTSDGNTFVQFNSDTSTNYSMTQLFGDGSSASSARNTSQVKTGIYTNYGAGANTYGTGIAHIMNYANTTTYKTMISRGNNETGTIARIHLWRSTSAINSIYMFLNSGNFKAGSMFTLYGILAA